jgi:hypothetical protein
MSIVRAMNCLWIQTQTMTPAWTPSAYREVTMGKLERDLQTLVEIERALLRMDEGRHATCVGCQSRILDACLKAIPLRPASNVLVGAAITSALRSGLHPIPAH